MSRHRGGVLLETVVSLAVFATAAVFTLRAATSVLDVLDRTGREAAAVDLACTKLAELEAGLIALADLRAARDDPDGDGWQVHAETERTAFRGLTMVALTVTEADVDGPIEITLRQLVQLRDEDVEAYEEDELLDDLPDSDDEPPFEEPAS